MSLPVKGSAEEHRIVHNAAAGDPSVISDRFKAGHTGHIDIIGEINSLFIERIILRVGNFREELQPRRIGDLPCGSGGIRYGVKADVGCLFQSADIRNLGKIHRCYAAVGVPGVVCGNRKTE